MITSKLQYNFHNGRYI